MQSRWRTANNKGYTLIELMVVIAIIAILSSIAIPNFIAYRDKFFCSMAESDANNIAAGLADYYAIPTHTALLVHTDESTITFTATKSFNLSGSNTGTIGGTIDSITISVTDVSGRCPQEYRTANQDVWPNGGNVVQKNM